MKILATFFALLLSTSAFAKTYQHWVEVGKTQGPNGLTSIMLDDARLIVDGDFNGFNVMTFYINPFSFNGKQIGTILSLFEVNCHTGEGRARRLSFIDLDSNEIEVGDTSWKTITGPPATQTLEAVRQRVCLKVTI
jgi:hypothetical protein